MSEFDELIALLRVGGIQEPTSRRVIAMLEELRSKLDAAVEAAQIADAKQDEWKDTCDAFAEENKELKSRLHSADERIERLRDWIQENLADDGCAYGEADFDACGRHKRHGICVPCSAAKVLAQDTFVSDPVVERQL